MKSKWTSLLITPGLVGLAVAPASAAEPGVETQSDSGIAELRQQLQNQQALIERQQQQLDALSQNSGQENDGNWLDQRRAEDVQALVRDVLNDADSRGSYLQDGVNAGYDGGFFIESTDGDFRLRINPEFQLRYIYNHREDTDDGADDDVNGFQTRRARLDFRGHALTPDLTYRYRFNANRDGGGLDLDYAYIGYQVTEALSIRGGQFKPNFIREEDVSAMRQLAVERSYAADYFTLDYAQGVELAYETEVFRPSVVVHDGSYSGDTEFDGDRTNLAVAGRGEFLLAGGWRQFRDYTSWSDDELGVLLGFGADYEWGESGAEAPDLLKYTADISAEFGGANLFAAAYGQQFNDNDNAGLPTGLDDANQFGFVVQGGVFVVPDQLELFSRYEWIDFDGVYYRNSGGGTSGPGDIASDELNTVTFGGNWYFAKHDAKFTLDLIWALDAVSAGNDGAGLLSSGDEQVALRSQFQFAF